MLYHFSENPAIDAFVPRQESNRRDMPPVVWAIDAVHEFSFYVPRNCPRIVCFRTPEMSAEEQALFFGASQAKVRLILGVEPGEGIAGFLHIGYFEPDKFPMATSRTPVEQKLIIYENKAPRTKNRV